MLLQVSTLLGALTAKDKLPQGQANSLIASAVTARVKSGAIRRSAERRLIEDMQTAMAQQMEASRESEVQAQQVRQTNAAQLADLHRHQVCFFLLVICSLLLCAVCVEGLATLGSVPLYIHLVSHCCAKLEQNWYSNACTACMLAENAGTWA